MNSTLTESKVLNIDRSGWAPMKLGNLANEISERVDTPSHSKYNRFVGLEHFVSGELKIKNWASTDNLTSSAKAFEAGDILFARRNAYLRRASMVEFNGCCSGDAFVLRENHELIVPGFLAFIVNSNSLWDYANSNAAGTMSKRVKWRDLANYELLLPPKDQQAELAELLWAMAETIENEIKVKEELDNTYFTLIDNLFSKDNNDWDFIKLGDIAAINKRSLNSKTDPNYQFEYLDLSSILEPKTLGNLNKMQFGNAPSRARRVVVDDSIVLALVRPYQKAFVYVENGKNIIASTGTAVVNMNDKQLARFVFHQFFSSRFSRYCVDRMTGTSYPAITPRDVEEYKISIPRDLSIIEQESCKLERIDNALLKAKSQIEYSKALQRSLINQFF